MVLIAMTVLRWRELKPGEVRARSDIFKKCDKYLEKQFLIARVKARKVQNRIPPLAYFGKILSRYVIMFWRKSIDYLVNFLLKIRQPAEKINENQQKNPVSPYLRDISDDKKMPKNDE